jgi:predicted MFS family arabinose efflux permease
VKKAAVLATKLGIGQTIAYGSSFYLTAVLANPISDEIGISVSEFFAYLVVAVLGSAALAPMVGAFIDRLGGRRVLPLSNVVFIIALMVMASANTPVLLLLAWLIMGVAMALGLYDAAFASVVALYGNKSRQIIAGITLFAGFASSISWPTTSFFVEEFSWQTSLIFWAAIHLFIALPLNLSIPSVENPQPRERMRGAVKLTPLVWVFVVMFGAQSYSIGGMGSTLPLMIESSGLSTQSAVAAAALMGPAQVSSRLLQVLFPKIFSPVVVAALAFIGHPVGAVGLLIFGNEAVWFFVAMSGVSMGLFTVASGTLPLLFFGPKGYGQRQGIMRIGPLIIGATAPLMVATTLAISLQLTLSINLVAGLISLICLGFVLTQPRLGSEEQIQTVAVEEEP